MRSSVGVTARSTMGPKARRVVAEATSTVGGAPVVDRALADSRRRPRGSIVVPLRRWTAKRGSSRSCRGACARRSWAPPCAFVDTPATQFPPINSWRDRLESQREKVLLLHRRSPRASPLVQGALGRGRSEESCEADPQVTCVQRRRQHPFRRRYTSSPCRSGSCDAASRGSGSPSASRRSPRVGGRGRWRRR